MNNDILKRSNDLRREIDSLIDSRSKFQLMLKGFNERKDLKRQTLGIEVGNYDHEGKWLNFLSRGKDHLDHIAEPLGTIYQTMLVMFEHTITDRISILEDEFANL